MNQLICPASPSVDRASQSERRARSARLELYSQAHTVSRLGAGALESGRADVLRLRTNLRDYGEEELPQTLVVLLEDPEHLLVGHRLGAFDADVVVRDHRD